MGFFKNIILMGGEMGRTIRGLIMFTLALCVIFDCITKQVDIWYFSVYFFIQLILIWWAVEDKGGKDEIH